MFVVVSSLSVLFAILFIFCFFFFNDTATTEIYTLSLHDALPIFVRSMSAPVLTTCCTGASDPGRSEEHTSELQSLRHLVCRLLLEKKKKTRQVYNIYKKKKKKTKQKNKHTYKKIEIIFTYIQYCINLIDLNLGISVFFFF